MKLPRRSAFSLSGDFAPQCAACRCPRRRRNRWVRGHDVERDAFADTAAARGTGRLVLHEPTPLELALQAQIIDRFVVAPPRNRDKGLVPDDGRKLALDISVYSLTH